MKICTFDLETIADKSKIDLLPEVEANKTLKDPAKIEADIAASGTSRSSLSGAAVRFRDD